LIAKILSNKNLIKIRAKLKTNKKSYGKLQVKKMLTSLAIREMKIKTTLKYYCVPIKKSNNVKYCQRMATAGFLTHCFWESKVAYPLEKQLVSFYKI
jgi:hypothetical protein